MKRINKIYRRGDTRVIKKFLFFPCTLERNEETSETRWLEYALVEQMYTLKYSGHGFYLDWEDIRFVDEEQA